MVRMPLAALHSSAMELLFRETHIPAQPPGAQTAPWFSRPQGNGRRPPRAAEAPRQGA